KSGVDLIELGIPFSDPIADGPTIQMSSETALRNGMTLQRTLEMAEEIRKRCSVPLVLMGYANPVYTYGTKKFVSRCAEIGVDGMIIPDVPLEESAEFQRLSQEHNIAMVFLAAPTTPDERLIQLDEHSTGFLYCVSITGVTGARQGLANQAEEFLQRARRCVKRNPLLVGFGIATPEDARRVGSISDGVIIGSALMKVIGNASGNHVVENAIRFITPIRNALDTLE
ncbi:MAG: tryptophan synthase subunit alpha, partial [Ignavibacteriales bacterium]|nr:tryptophan synthase subunit alpha [Ignavibacteriales bacterium]